MKALRSQVGDLMKYRVRPLVARIPGRLQAIRHRGRLQDLERFVIFVGYPRSGHTLVGALLDAHPAMLVAHELDVLRYVRAGAQRGSILGLLLRRHAWFRAHGRRWTGYDYDVAGQDTSVGPRVIGDKAGGMTTGWLLQDPGLLNTLQQRVGLPVHVIHHVRSPMDNLATVVQKDGLSRDAALDAWEARTRGLVPILGSCRSITTHHDDLVADPSRFLVQLAEHLQLDAPRSWLEASGKLVFDKPRRTGSSVRWNREQMDRICDILETAPWLARYIGTQGR